MSFQQLRSAGPVALAGVVLLLLAPLAHAHRLDELLQASLIAIEPDSITIQLNLTPGVEIADEFIPNLDRDRNGLISAKELKAYGEKVRSNLRLDLDHHPLRLKVINRASPDLTDLRKGQGTIHLEFKASAQKLGVGAHQLVFRNEHLAKLSVYLANVIAPSSGEIEVQNQSRNPNQSELHVAFTRRVGPSREGDSAQR